MANGEFKMFQENWERLMDSYMVDNEVAWMLSIFDEDGSEFVIPSQWWVYRGYF